MTDASQTEGPHPEGGAARTGEPVLRVSGLSAWYGSIVALRDVELEVRRGEVVAVLGPNGAGKSTLMGSIAGAHQSMDGSVEIEGQQVRGLPPEQIVRRGVALVPEGRKVFAGLTVEQNLTMGAASRPRGELGPGLERTYDLFPVLAERRVQPAGTLSGGEQQQLSIARALMSQPRIVLYDEPSLGLAPLIVEHIFELISSLRAEGITTVLVEQNAHRAIRLADWVYVLSSGRLVLSGPAAQFADRDLRELYLGRVGNST
jgi:branched-chain amino acid transport system ATP-binding protein